MKTKADRFGVVYSADGKRLLKCRNKKLREYTVKDCTEIIEDDAFMNCIYLEHILLPESLMTISDGAFFDCTSLKSIVLPKALENFGNCVFGRSCEMVEICVDSANPYFTSVDGVLFSRNMTRIVQYAPGKSGDRYIIPDSVTEIAPYAFYGSCELKSVVIPDGVVSIGEMSFGYCKELESVTIVPSVRTIGAAAFANGHSLKSIFIPKSVEKIGSGAFAYCWELEIRCESESKPEGWDENWNFHKWPVVWGAKL